MPTASNWGITPRQSIEAACLRRGTAGVVAGCIQLIGGTDVDADLLVALGGPAAGKFLDGQPHDDRYWLRVWGLRGLLWAWEERAAEVVRGALADESWRVRELAVKVAAKRLIGDALPAVDELRDDPVPRVRAAADRALRILAAARA